MTPDVKTILDTQAQQIETLRQRTVHLRDHVGEFGPLVKDLTESHAALRAFIEGLEEKKPTKK